MTIKTETVQAVVALATSGINLALQAYRAAQQLRADGVVVPGLEELEADVRRLQALPDLAGTQE